MLCTCQWVANFLQSLLVKKTVKIDQYLAKIWTKYDSLLFFGPPCICRAYISVCTLHYSLKLICTSEKLTLNLNWLIVLIVLELLWNCCWIVITCLLVSVDACQWYSPRYNCLASRHLETVFPAELTFTVHQGRSDRGYIGIYIPKISPSKHFMG